MRKELVASRAHSLHWHRLHEYIRLTHTSESQRSGKVVRSSMCHNVLFVLSPQRSGPLVLDIGRLRSILDLNQRLIDQNVQKSVQMLSVHFDVGTLALVKCVKIIILVHFSPLLI